MKNYYERGVFMEDRVKLAVNRFIEGFNCSQSVLSSFSDLFDIEQEVAFKISSGFGAGIGRKQEVCGAVSGGVMLVGLKYGKVKASDNVSHEKTYLEVRKLCDEFSKINGSIICKELLGCDINTPEGMQYAIENNLFKTKCVKCVEDAAKIVSRMLAEDKL